MTADVHTFKATSSRVHEWPCKLPPDVQNVIDCRLREAASHRDRSTWSDAKLAELARAESIKTAQAFERCAQLIIDRHFVERARTASTTAESRRSLELIRRIRDDGEIST